MTILTAGGSFASAYMNNFPAEVVSIRELGDDVFWEKIRVAKKIIHNAASIGCTGLSDCVLKNFDFSRKLVDFLVENNPTVDLVYISSMSILDPISDKTYLGLERMTSYAYSKYISEGYFLKSKMVNLKCVRFSTLFYGDPLRDGLSKIVHDAITKQEISIYNGGEDKRDFMPLNIAVAYVGKIVGIENNKKEIFNVVSGKETSFGEIAQYLKKVIPNLKINDLDIKNSSLPVLSRFRLDSINRLGEIEFSLKEEINKYIEKILKYEGVSVQ